MVRERRICEQPAAPFGAAKGTIKYLPTGEQFGFINACQPEPRESVWTLRERRPAPPRQRRLHGALARGLSRAPLYQHIEPPTLLTVPAAKAACAANASCLGFTFSPPQGTVPSAAVSHQPPPPPRIRLCRRCL